MDRLWSVLRPPFVHGCKMRQMELPLLSQSPTALEECLDVYVGRLRRTDGPALVVRSGISLLAYMLWPNNEARRDGWVTTNAVLHPLRDAGGRDFQAVPSDGVGSPISAVAKLASGQLEQEVAQVQPRWLDVADVFQTLVDMAYDKSVKLRGGPSISKAVSLVEEAHGTRGRSQLMEAWSKFRDAAHLIAAGAFLAHEVTKLAPPIADGASIFRASLVAPDAVLAIAAGYEQFGLSFKPVSQAATVLRPETVWRVPTHLVPRSPPLVWRRLTAQQIQFLEGRRAN